MRVKRHVLKEQTRKQTFLWGSLSWSKYSHDTATAATTYTASKYCYNFMMAHSNICYHTYTYIRKSDSTLYLSEVFYMIKTSHLGCFESKLNTTLTLRSIKIH